MPSFEFDDRSEGAASRGEKEAFEVFLAFPRMLLPSVRATLKVNKVELNLVF